jgi:hypothetical protein
VPGARKLRRIKHFSSGEGAFFAHEVPPFHYVKCKVADGSAKLERSKSFGHMLKLQIDNNSHVFNDKS